MKPHVVMHMGISIDGRIVPKDWPDGRQEELDEIYEDVHKTLKGDAWIVGRVTMAEFGEGKPKPAKAKEPIARETWKAENAGKGPYGVAIDEKGKLHLNKNTANDDPIVAVLVESVSDDHLAELQRDGISYLFAGKHELDLSLAIERLNTDFGVKRLLLEGGGGINASFLEAGLIDEISLLVAPVADGNDGPTLFTHGAAKGVALKLDGVETIKKNYVHLRYTVEKSKR